MAAKGKVRTSRVDNFGPSSTRTRLTDLLATVTGMIKLALQAGKANPAPPVGPALGAKVSVCCLGMHNQAYAVLLAHKWRVGLQGVNIMAFCKEYNAATQDKVGTVIPVEITVFEVSRSILLASCSVNKRSVVCPTISGAANIMFHLVTNDFECYNMCENPFASPHWVFDCHHLILQDRSFTFILKTPPASVLLAKAAGVAKGSGNPKTEKVGKISQAQLKVCRYVRALILRVCCTLPACCTLPSSSGSGHQQPTRLTAG